MFASSVRSTQDLAGVFEYDGGMGYFYLYDQRGGEEQRVVGAIRVLTTPPDFDQESITVRWDKRERHVGLFIKHVLWAAFDSNTNEKFGGNYVTGMQPNIPIDVARSLSLDDE